MAQHRLGDPLGVVVVIPPWNFPLAIMAGMTTAALVAGNTVVLKPSSDAPTIARHFVDLLEQNGLPPGASLDERVRQAARVMLASPHFMLH